MGRDACVDCERLRLQRDEARCALAEALCWLDDACASTGFNHPYLTEFLEEKVPVFSIGLPTVLVHAK